MSLHSVKRHADQGLPRDIGLRFLTHAMRGSFPCDGAKKTPSRLGPGGEFHERVRIPAAPQGPLSSHERTWPLDWSRSCNYLVGNVQLILLLPHKWKSPEPWTACPHRVLMSPIYSTPQRGEKIFRALRELKIRRLAQPGRAVLLVLDGWDRNDDLLFEARESYCVDLAGFAESTEVFFDHRRTKCCSSKTL